MSSFEPSRIPAWLAPVWDERSVSHSVRRCVSSASQRAMVGALPSRIARRRMGRASPSISRNRIPGTSVRAMMPCRRAIRCAIRIPQVSSEPRRTASRRLAAAATSEARRAQPKPSTLKIPSVRSSASEQDAGVREQHEQEAENERERQPQRGEHRRDDRVQRCGDRRDEERPKEVVDADAGQDPGGHHQCDARSKPRGEKRDRAPAGTLRLPRHDPPA